jgi:hypothetical protein
MVIATLYYSLQLRPRNAKCFSSAVVILFLCDYHMRQFLPSTSFYVGCLKNTSICLDDLKLDASSIHVSYLVTCYFLLFFLPIALYISATLRVHYYV